MRPCITYCVTYCGSFFPDRQSCGSNTLSGMSPAPKTTIIQVSATIWVWHYFDTALFIPPDVNLNEALVVMLS